MLLDPDGATSAAPSALMAERARVREQSQMPSPCRGLVPAITLSRDAGPGIAVRDLPKSGELLALARELMLGELLPLLPPTRERDARLVITAMAIAEREASAGVGPSEEIATQLAEFYGSDDASLGRLAGDLCAGTFEACNRRGQAARAILWRLTILKLCEGNPGYLAANGFGEYARVSGERS
jgi:hypothetical protein